MKNLINLINKTLDVLQFIAEKRADFIICPMGLNLSLLLINL